MNKSDIDPKKVKLAATVEIPTTLYSLCYDHRSGQLFGAGTDWTVYALDVDNQGAKAQQKWTNHKNYVSSLVLIGEVILSFDRVAVSSRGPDRGHMGKVIDVASIFCKSRLLDWKDSDLFITRFAK